MHRVPVRLLNAHDCGQVSGGVRRDPQQAESRVMGGRGWVEGEGRCAGAGVFAR